MFSVVQVSHCCRCSSVVYFWPEPPSRPGFSTTPSGSGCAAGSEAPSDVTHTRTDTHLVNMGVSTVYNLCGLAFPNCLRHTPFIMSVRRWFEEGRDNFSLFFVVSK